ADDVADRPRGLLVLGAGIQAQLAHRVDDAALDRLQAVADVGQRPVEDDVHRVVEVGLLRERTKRDLLDGLELESVLVALGHAVSRLPAYTSARLPFVSSQLRRSPARFFDRSMSRSRSVSSTESAVSCTSRRVSGSIVVSRSCSGLISPSPLKRVTLTFPRTPSAARRSMMPLRSASSSA